MVKSSNVRFVAHVARIKLKESDSLGDLDVDGRILLKFILNRVWIMLTEFISR